MACSFISDNSKPVSEGPDPEDSYTLTDLSSCRAEIKELQPSNAHQYADVLLAELDVERPSTSGRQNDGYKTQQCDDVAHKDTTNGGEADIYQYYYMVEDSHEDVLKKLEEELMREEAEEKERADATGKLMMEVERDAEHFDHIRELEKEKEIYEKMAKEKRKEKERIRELRRQLAIENKNLELFCCFVCSKVFAEEENMRQHVSEKHLASYEEYKFKCSRCYRRFMIEHHLRRHQETHKRITFACSVCRREFREEISLEIHMSKIHSLSLDGKKLEKVYGCKCGLTFGLEKEVKRHRYYCGNRDKIAEQRRIAREELDALSSISSACSISSCSDTASTPSLGSVSGRPVKDKSCPFCFLVCASMQSRRRHIERKHPELINDVAVDQHQYVKVHSVTLPYICGLCSKTFATHASLSTHKKRIHEDKNIHECSICGKRYPLASELRKHIKRVHEKLIQNDNSKV